MLKVVSGLLPPKSSIASGVSSLPHKESVAVTMRPTGKSDAPRTQSRYSARVESSGGGVLAGSPPR